MKKKVTAIALAVCILAVAVIGATMAYFTDTDSKTNTFTFGGVDIELNETSEEDKKNNIHAGAEKNGGFTYDKVLPGLVYSKVPEVTVVEGPAWVVVTVTVPTIYDHADFFNGTANERDFVMEKKVVGKNTIYYFYSTAKDGVAAGTSLKLFEQVKINPALTQADVINLPTFNVVVNAYGIQKEGFDDAKSAFAAAFSADSTALRAAIEEAAAGSTVTLADEVALEEALSVNKDLVIEGNGTAKITKQPVEVGAENTVTFRGVNFDDTTGGTVTSSVYGNNFKGTLVFEDCTFGASNWEAIQVTPAADCEIIIKNCTFTAPKAMKRFIHIQAPANNNYKVDITVTGCTFVGCDNTNYNASDPKSVIDFDYIAAGSTMTLGNCSFFNTDGTTATDAHAYFCAPDGTRTYDYAEMYDMLTGTVTTCTVK